MALLFLFVAVPLLEIAIFVQLGSILDLGWILLIVVLTAILGTWLVRQQGRGILRRIQNSFETLHDPTEPLAHGAMILFSGALLLTPGFFTDAVGFLLLIPAFRHAAFLWLRRRVVVQSVATGGDGGHPAHPERRPSDSVIDGDYTDVTGDRRREDRDPRRPSGWTQD